MSDGCGTNGSTTRAITGWIDERLPEGSLFVRVRPLGLFLADQCHGGDGNAFLPPLEAQMLCGCSFDRHPVIVYTHCVGHRGAHGVDVRPQFGPLCADRAVHVSDLIAFLTQQRRDFPQQYLRVDAPELVRRVGEMQSDVAQRRILSCARSLCRRAPTAGRRPGRVRRIRVLF